MPRLIRGVCRKVGLSISGKMKGQGTPRLYPGKNTHMQHLTGRRRAQGLRQIKDGGLRGGDV